MTLCACGCGQPTKLAGKTDRSKGYIKGEPIRFVRGHGFGKPERLLMDTGTGLCGCGCGESTPLAKETCLRRGLVKGKPMRFINGHQGRMQNPGYTVDEQTGCWNYNGYVRADGRAGSVSNHGSPTAAYRALYIQRNGPIPDGLVLDHLCRNPRCMNPEHLEPVTPAVNTRRGAGTILTAADVQAIRDAVAAGRTHTAVAAERGVSRSLVSFIAEGRRWSVA